MVNDAGKKIQILSIISCCCTISYCLPKNSVFSWIAILLSAGCILVLALKKEHCRLWGGVMLGAYAVKLIEDIPYVLNMAQEIPSILVLLAVIGIVPQNKKAVFIAAIITSCTVLAVLIFDCRSVIIQELSIALSSPTSLIYYSRELIFKWAAEIFSCYVYPVMVSMIILKKDAHKA